ncbi:MAG: nucleotidyl transferase AbiEii/AbiGii toxin family protein, partial [Treponema sp.]|nr:nucleotidyl transferase AbiEii/AbiGii toxin family protein [Treponema sp.]
VHYKEAEYNPIKIEISFRNIDNDNILDYKTNINGLNTYNINYLANNKINTFLDRMAARDIFDAAYLFREYPDVIDKGLILKCKDKMNSIGIDQLEKIIKSDEILKDFDTDDILINFDKNLNNLYNENTEITRSRSR